ncbi:hypothetical protein [Sphingobium lactosutens]|uniref:Uncharacterized protein n=1 Tax=Sphingobium lactosutens DS20 TaxID=1331060 RepID=T0IQH1_9SPHN|nr:hypothetical protein [Sphingobium lactosutens]EQB11874.1 hypothetical protein RLDS_22360 [Sphingobium lactosutens DS20]
MAALAGVAAAVALLATPVGLLEMLVASSGLSEALPAAAPPLGLTARLTMAVFVGVLIAGAVAASVRDPRRADDEQDMDGRQRSAQGARQMGFAFSKLTALARGRAAPIRIPDAPALRRADAHPDAPPRPPIFASRDFDGVEIFARPDAKRRPLIVAPEPESQSVVPMQGVARPSPDHAREADQPTPSFARPADKGGPSADPVAFEADVEEIAGDEAERCVEQEAANVVRPSPPPLPTHGLSVAELTDRLERGLASRRRATTAPVLADMPVAPAVPVRDSVAPDADEALRAALGTLRTMAARRR